MLRMRVQQKGDWRIRLLGVVVARFDPALLFAPYTGGCYANGESSLAVRKELSQGPVVVSMVGYTAVYNTLDNNRAPTSGIVLEFKQDFAGIGGDIKFIRTTSANIS